VSPVRQRVVAVNAVVEPYDEVNTPTTVEEAWETKPLVNVPNSMNVEAPVTVSVEPRLAAPVIVPAPTMVEEACERNPFVNFKLEEKMLEPEKVLSFERSVEEAAVIVNVPPAVIAVELMVARVPVR
jgi:hypothetical protein